MFNVVSYPLDRYEIQTRCNSELLDSAYLLGLPSRASKPPALPSLPSVIFSMHAFVPLSNQFDNILCDLALSDS